MSQHQLGEGIANGKIILMGEHAVVYHEPAIAIPFPATQIHATVTKTLRDDITINCHFYSGIINEMPELLTSLKITIKETLLRLNQPTNGLDIHIESTIPPERGMGSSAAVAVATIRSLYDFYDTPLSSETLLELVEIAETITHGNPSGIDALMTSSTCPYYYVKGEEFVPFSLNINATLIVADTGFTGKTKETVGHVAELLANDQDNVFSTIIEKLGELSNLARTATQTNQPQQLGTYMNQAHHYLQQLEVSSPELDKLVTISIENGALGAKMTGGGRGGCMIAIAFDETSALKIMEKLHSSGAVSTWHYTMEAHE